MNRPAVLLIMYIYMVFMSGLGIIYSVRENPVIT